MTDRLTRLLVLLSVLPLAACTSAKVKPGPPTAPVDLSSARQAVEAARTAGAPVRAAAQLGQAEQHLAQAESLTAAPGSTAADSVRAQALADLATAEAQWALDLARLTAAPDKAARASAAETERLSARLKKAEEDRRRQDERIALLLHDLEVTETEVIRTKARLKGLETKAEAASAIAEARILMRRLDARLSAASLSRCEDALAKAEQQLQQENYGAAVFFAAKAQDAATKARESPESRRPSPSPPS